MSGDDRRRGLAGDRDRLYEVRVALYAGERSMLLAMGEMRAAGWLLQFAFAHPGGLYQVVYVRERAGPGGG